jgi:glycosyltransferase involved in cell wall biosynthesis
MLRQFFRLPKDVDFIMLHSLYSFPVLVGYTLARLYRKPYGFWPHGVLAPVQRGVSPGKKALYDRVVARSVMDNASVILYSSVGERDQTAPLNLRSPSVVIPHGLELKSYQELPARGHFRQKYFGGHEGPLVLCLGRLNAKKGLDLLARSMAQVVGSVPDVRLAIVGGSDPPDFVNQVKIWLSNHGVEQNTVLTGLLSEPEKLSAFADADVFVSPSYAENFGFAMFEAMACGVPVVVSETLDYAPEVVRCEAGLARPREASEFAAAIVSLLEDERYRRRLGENGKELAKSYGWQTCAEQLERTIQNILSGRSL